jgi:hypothetical protein
MALPGSSRPSGQICSARTATPRCRPALPPGAVRAQRGVHANGRIVINGQFVKLGRKDRHRLANPRIDERQVPADIFKHGSDLLATQPGQTIIGDKGYVSNTSTHSWPSWA